MPPSCAKTTSRPRRLPLLLALGAMVGISAFWGVRRFAPSPAGQQASTQPGPVPRPEKWWRQAHKELSAEVRDADRPEKEGYGLLFYGDSITEGWRRGDDWSPCEGCQGAKAVFEEAFGEYRPNALGVGGDQTGQLLWRLLHGELPKRHPPRAVVLLIGTNDLGAAAEGVGEREAAAAAVNAVPALLHRVQLMLRLLRSRLPGTQVLLLGLLPCGTPQPGPRQHAWPGVLTTAVREVGLHLKTLASLDGHLHFAECGDRFLASGGGGLDPELLPDALHPSLSGYRALAECLQPAVAKLMARAGSDEQA